MNAVTTIKPHLSGIAAPDEMRNLPAWLVWRFEYHEGEDKPRKVPYYTTGGKRHGKQGAPEDLQQLTTFDAARTAAVRRGFDGVGFVPRPEFNICALDFDHCVSNGELHPDLVPIVTSTYAEYSPSGVGVRAFVKGQYGNSKARGEPYGFEVFSTKGFVTFTGNRLDIVDILGNDNTVASVDEPVRALCAKRFSKPGPELHVSAGEPVGLTPAQIEGLLAALDPNMGHDDWLAVGMGLHHETQGEGFDYWADWSELSEKFPGREVLLHRWSSFGKNHDRTVTLRTAMKMAGISPNAPASADEFPAIEAPAGEEPFPSFERDKQGKILPTVTNAVAALRRVDFCDANLAHDEFKDATMVAWGGQKAWRPLRDTDYTRLRGVLERRGFKNPGRELVRDAIMQIAEDNRFDSAIQWAEALVWDGVPRVDGFMTKYMGVTAGDYAQSVSRYTWTALAARCLVPGAKCDMVPVLVGGQGTGKSTGVMAMSPDPDAYVEVNLETRDDNLARSLRGKLVGELGELRGLATKDAEAIKAWITRTHEEWIPKYVEFATKFPRRLLFIGTTNSDEFLADDTGERRWLPVDVGSVDVDSIVRDRDQLWAEAIALFKAGGVQWREALTLAADKHDDYKVTDPWQSAIEAWLATDEMDSPEGQPRSALPFKLEHVLHGALGLDTRGLSMREQKRAASVLRRLGFTKRRATRAEGGKHIWERATNCKLEDLA